MTGPKRTPIQREHDQERITDLYLRGMRQVDIAEQVGITQQQVSYDLAAIQRRWQQQTTRNLDEAKSRELARIDLLERTYWKAWERSLQERTTTRTSRLAGAAAASILKQSQPGNPAFLAGVQWCIEQRCKLLGLFAPVKQELRGTDGEPLRILIEYA